MKNKGSQKERVLVFDQEGVQKLAVRIKAMREELGLSQEDVAHGAIISVSQVSRIERGLLNPTVSTIFHIARAMKVPVANLFQFGLTPLEE
ncbi:MAG: helix-turn-helix transcriptional regulator [Flavobacteriales bacterium]|nr:helix-turn-helix transcriptional regulator [Flavobacteriales bacterium]